MEIHQLRYFVAVADEGNFSRAAAKVRVAQPSLSQQIRKLEAEVGQPLFDRLPRSVVLTEAGHCLIDYARQILASIVDARRCVDEFKGEVAGRRGMRPRPFDRHDLAVARLEAEAELPGAVGVHLELASHDVLHLGAG